VLANEFEIFTSTIHHQQLKNFVLRCIFVNISRNPKANGLQSHIVLPTGE